jgi:hypothetical protein
LFLPCQPVSGRKIFFRFCALAETARALCAISGRPLAKPTKTACQYTERKTVYQASGILVKFFPFRKEICLRIQNVQVTASIFF